MNLRVASSSPARSARLLKRLWLRRGSSFERCARLLLRWHRDGAVGMASSESDLAERGRPSLVYYYRIWWEARYMYQRWPGDDVFKRQMKEAS